MYIHLVPTLRMHGTIPPLPHVFTVWCLNKEHVFIASYLVVQRDNFTFRNTELYNLISNPM